MTYKKKIILLMSLVTLCIVGAIYSWFDFPYKRTLQFRGHVIEYKQYIKGKKKLYDAHYLDNESLEDQAYMKLANRLLDDYLEKPDTELRDDVLKIFNEHNNLGEVEVTSIDSLVSNRRLFMDTIIYIE